MGIEPQEEQAQISIHAPREGGDVWAGRRLRPDGISIHAPREGGDHILGGANRKKSEFQSTPPARGATFLTPSFTSHHLHFNPRPPRGGRQQRCTVLPADL